MFDVDLLFDFQKQRSSGCRSARQVFFITSRSLVPGLSWYALVAQGGYRVDSGDAKPSRLGFRTSLCFSGVSGRPPFDLLLSYPVEDLVLPLSRSVSRRGSLPRSILNVTFEACSDAAQGQGDKLS